MALATGDTDSQREPGTHLILLPRDTLAHDLPEQPFSGGLLGNHSTQAWPRGTPLLAISCKTFRVGCNCRRGQMDPRRPDPTRGQIDRHHAAADAAKNILNILVKPPCRD